MKSLVFAYNKLNQKKYAAMLILLITSMGLLWQIISGISALRPQKTVNIPPKVLQKEAEINSQSALFKKNIFGLYVADVSVDSEIKQSTLDAQILGILFSPDEKDSQAIIRVGGGPESYYQIGDTLPGGAVIKQISKEGVIVLYRGALESLSLPKNELLFEPPVKVLPLKSP